MFTVEFMGSQWSYRLPRAHAAALLASLGAKEEDTRVGALLGFIEHVMEPESVDLLIGRAMNPADSFDVEQLAELIERIQQAHSARPFHVDVNLAATAVRNWPQVRGKLVMSGIGDPLRQLPTVYALIDAVEAMILEGFSKQEEQDKYFAKLYRPPAGSMAKGITPKGFSKEEELAAFADWED